MGCEMKKVLFIAATALSLLPLSAFSDEALYGAAPSADAVFFRFVNASAEPLEVSVDGQAASKLTSRKVSPYGFLPAGKLSFSLDGKNVDLDLKQGEQISLIWLENDEYKVIYEDQFDNKKKARIKLYNISDYPTLELKTADGKHQVLEPIEQFDKGVRDVNAIRVPFSVVAPEGESVKVTDPILLTRDKVTTIFAFQNNSDVLFTIEETER